MREEEEEDDGGGEGDKGTWAMDPGIHLNGLLPITSLPSAGSVGSVSLPCGSPRAWEQVRGLLEDPSQDPPHTASPLWGQRPLRNWPQIPGFLEPLNFRGYCILPVHTVLGRLSPERQGSGYFLRNAPASV